MTSPRRDNRRSLRRRFATVALLPLLVTACVTGGGESEEDVSETGEVPTDVQGTVRVLMEEVPDTDIVKNMVSQFNQTYPNVEVQIETLTYDQMRDKLVASFQAPEPVYDLVVVDNPWMHDFAQAGFLQPLEGRIESTEGYQYDDFAQPLREIGEVDGHTYGVPFYNYALGLIYRTDLFEQAGLTPPKTLQDLQAAASQLSTAQRAGMAMQPQRGYKVFEEWGNYLFAAGGSIYGPDGEPTLDTPEAREALRTYIDVYEQSAPNNSLNWAFDEALRAISSDNAAMMVSYNWMLPTLNKKGGQAGDLAGEFGLAPMPGGKQVLGAWHWAIPQNSATPDAAWAFVSWISSPEVAKERVIAGGAPVRKSVIEDPQVADQGYGAEYYDTVGTLLENSAPLSQGPSGEEMIQAVGTELNAAVAGLKSVDEALRAAQEQAARIQGE